MAIDLKEFFEDLRRKMPTEQRNRIAANLRDRRKRTILKTTVVLRTDGKEKDEIIPVFLIIPQGHFDGTLHISFLDFNSHWSYYASDLLIGPQEGKYPSLVQRLTQNPEKGFYVDTGHGIHIPNKDMLRLLGKCDKIIKEKNLTHLLHSI